MPPDAMQFRGHFLLHSAGIFFWLCFKIKEIKEQKVFL